MYYIYIDGDDIGLEIEKSFLDNDEISLGQINKEINSVTKEMSDYMVKAGLSILFLGADGIICKGENINIKELSSYIKEISNKFTFSIGVGNNLRDSFLALRYAKSIGKDVNILFINHVFEIVRSENSS